MKSQVPVQLVELTVVLQSRLWKMLFITDPKGGDAASSKMETTPSGARRHPAHIHGAAALGFLRRRLLPVLAFWLHMLIHM